jgi:16S rRNA (guanine(527)-N(7))-methyltransferase RsmG
MLLNKIVNHDLCFCFEMNELLRFEQSLVTNMGSYELDLSSETRSNLSTFYSLLMHWNDRLHLVAPCSPEEFATRHVLESLLLVKQLPREAKIADVGSGGGLPIIPCLVARPDLNATLIESSQKKAIFLREALTTLDRKSSIVARPFEEVETPHVSFVTCRALDQFISKVSSLIDWAPAGSTLLLYGGETLREQLNKTTLNYESILIPLSKQRFLFKVLSAECA